MVITGSRVGRIYCMATMARATNISHPALFPTGRKRIPNYTRVIEWCSQSMQTRSSCASTVQSVSNWANDQMHVLGSVRP